MNRITWKKNFKKEGKNKLKRLKTSQVKGQPMRRNSTIKTRRECQ